MSVQKKQLREEEIDNDFVQWSGKMRRGHDDDDHEFSFMSSIERRSKAFRSKDRCMATRYKVFLLNALMVGWLVGWWSTT